MLLGRIEWVRGACFGRRSMHMNVRKLTAGHIQIGKGGSLDVNRVKKTHRTPYALRGVDHRGATEQSRLGVDSSRS